MKKNIWKYLWLMIGIVLIVGGILSIIPLINISSPEFTSWDYILFRFFMVVRWVAVPVILIWGGLIIINKKFLGKKRIWRRKKQQKA